MGNTMQLLSDNVCLFADTNTWIEGNAIQQLIKTSGLPGMRRVVGMPDLHPGRGYPIGAAFFTEGLIYPALIGSDIGCGMAFWQTDLAEKDWSKSKLDRRLGNLDKPLDDSALLELAPSARLDQPFRHSLGTIGAGNHFAELQAIDTVFDSQTFDQLGLHAGRLQLLVHSGSRGMGQHILRQHVDRHGHAGLPSDGDAARVYLNDHNAAVNYARLNRELIAGRILQRLGADGQGIFDIDHNTVSPFECDGIPGWLHRKGAAPADRGVLIIPGSRGDYSFLVLPTRSTAGLASLAHGAGRKWQRADCKDRLAGRHTPASLSKTKLGSHVICADRALIYEEAPEAYKPIESVIEVLANAGLLVPIARLRPVLSYKTRGECCE
jgi:release factor H-coupled RctB family protein